MNSSEKSYDFNLPDRSVKFPFEKVPKTLNELSEDFNMIKRAIEDIDQTIASVDWAILMPTQSLTGTFVEAKTGLMAARKKFDKIMHTLDKEIEKYA